MIEIKIIANPNQSPTGSDLIGTINYYGFWQAQIFGYDNSDSRGFKYFLKLTDSPVQEIHNPEIVVRLYENQFKNAVNAPNLYGELYAINNDPFQFPVSAWMKYDSDKKSLSFSLIRNTSYK